MKIKHNDILIPDATPFENCKLGREKYAIALTSIINAYTDGFVLAINNEWGTGKTTFIKMWQQYLVNSEYKTLYFNAWENDFESSPLIAILSELKTITNKSNNATFKSLLKKGAVISQHTIPLIAKAVAKRYIDIEEVSNAIESLSEAATDILKEEVNEYANKRKGLIEFREELKKFVQKNSNDKPLVFFIDELDRCKPTYAVEVLEQIKHFFNVSGITFVLSIDKVQLGNAIKGYYGSDHINSNEYLRRFIDLEFSMPEPDVNDFCYYLYSYFQFDTFINSAERTSYSPLHEEKSSFLNFSIALFKKGGVTLRQQEKIFAHARVVLNIFKHNNYLFPSLYILLIYLKTLDFALYRKIREKKFSIQELLDELKIIYPANMIESGLLITTEALLTMFYTN